MKSKLTVTDHAVVRFLERSMGMDVQAIRDRILQSGVAEAMRAGATGIKIDGVVYKFRNGSVTTCVRLSENNRGRGF